MTEDNNKKVVMFLNSRSDLHSCVPVWNTEATCWNMLWQARSKAGNRTSRLTVCRLDWRAVDVLWDNVSIVC